MNRPPAFQFYADDFLSGTMLMSDAEVGKYIRALCIQWNKGGLTDEDMARLGLTTVEPPLSSGSSLVATKFQRDSNGIWKNSRLESEREKQKLYRERQSDAGKASAEARLNRRSTTVQPTLNTGSTDVQPEGQPKVNSPSPSPSPDGNINKARGTLEEVRQWFAEKQLPESDAEYFFHKMESSDWTVSGEKVKRWKSTVSAWKAANYFPSQKQLAASKPAPRTAVFGRDFI